MAWVTEDRKNEGLIQKFDLKTNIALPIQSLVRKGLFVDVTKENAIADEFIENLHVKQREDLNRRGFFLAEISKKLFWQNGWQVIRVY